MDIITKYIGQLHELESSWDTRKAIEWTAEHTEVPAFAIR